MSKNSILSDLVLGAIVGGASVWVLDQVDQAMYDSEPAIARRQTVAARPGGLDPAHVIANRLAARVGITLSPKQPHPAGIAVHYGLGALMGAVYGALRRRVRGVAAGHGIGYGAAMFAVQDEGLNTLMKTGGHPLDYPWQDHVRGFVAHSVFGYVLETGLRVLRDRD